MQDVGVEVDRSGTEPAVATGVELDDSGFADFSVTGTRVSGEYRCADCGYGAIVHNALPPCPMCGATIWESRGTRVPRLAD